MKRWIIALVAVAVLGGGGWFAWGAFGRSDEGPKEPTMKVERGDLIETAAASGTIHPNVQVEVKSRASGEVIEILVEEGQKVKAGDLLVRLDPADAERVLRETRTALRRIQAQLAESKASLTVAKLERGNAETSSAVSEKGVKLGLVSTESARTSSHQVGVANANVKLREAQLAAGYTQLDTARLDVEDAELRLAETEIKAPIAATVLSLGVEKGSIVSSALTNVSGGTAVVTLADLTDLRVIGAIDEAQVGRVKAEQEVVIRVDAYPTETFKGKVLRVSPLGVEVSSVVTFDVEIVINDDKASLLRSGMSADLEIVTAQREGVLLIPLTAVQSQGAARTVRLASGERAKIRTGATDGTSIEVLEGLEEGDEILGAPAKSATPRPAGSANRNPMIPNMRGGGR